MLCSDWVIGIGRVIRIFQINGGGFGCDDLTINLDMSPTTLFFIFLVNHLTGMFFF